MMRAAPPAALSRPPVECYNPLTTAYFILGGCSPPAMIQFTDIHLTPLSKGALRVSLRVHYDGSRGFPVIASARLLDGWRSLPWASAPPMAITQGSAVGQPVQFDLRFAVA